MLCFILFFSSRVTSQHDFTPKKHQFITVNAGYFIVAISGGINYEVSLKNPRWAISAGINYYAQAYGDGSDGALFHIGAMHRSKNFDFTLGISSIDKDVFPTSVIPFFSLSYRKYFNDEKMLFRVGLGLIDFLHVGIGFRI
jgi:hypothetical protein